MSMKYKLVREIVCKTENNKCIKCKIQIIQCIECEMQSNQCFVMYNVLYL